MSARIPIMAILLLLGTTAQAASQGDTFLTVQYAMVTYDEEGFDEAEPTAVVFRYGQFVNENVSVEGRFGLGLQDDEIDAGGFDVDIEVDSLFGVYVAVHAFGETNSSFYGIVGVTQGELEGSAFGITISEDESGFSYGIGARFGQFNIEYMNYLDEDDFEATAISLGYVF